MNKARMDALLTFHHGITKALAILYGPPVPQAERDACAVALGRPDLIPEPEQGEILPWLRTP